jgi:hypothetical protein
MPTRTSLLALLLVGAAGCPSQTAETPAVRFPPQTTLTLSSSRCQGQSCACRPLDANEGQAEENIPAGHKRFELRLPKTTSAIWVSIAGKGVFYKAAQSLPPACFYVDLPAGEHTLTVHSETKDTEVGLQTGLKIYEYGPKGPFWYRSLDFVCGHREKCTKPAIQTWVDFQQRLPRGVLDPCGSTMIRGFRFDGTREEKALPEYLELDLTMQIKVYAFETFRVPGSGACKAPVKNT